MKKIILLFSIILTFAANTIEVSCQGENHESIIVLSFKDERGQSLKKDITIKGYMNEEYHLDTYQIEGYTLKNIVGNKSGMFLSNNSTITYIYEPIPHTNTNKPLLILPIIILIFLVSIKKLLT